MVLYLSETNKMDYHKCHMKIRIYDFLPCLRTSFLTSLPNKDQMWSSLRILIALVSSLFLQTKFLPEKLSENRNENMSKNIIVWAFGVHNLTRFGFEDFALIPDSSKDKTQMLIIWSLFHINWQLDFFVMTVVLQGLQDFTAKSKEIVNKQLMKSLVSILTQKHWIHVDVSIWWWLWPSCCHDCLPNGNHSSHWEWFEIQISNSTFCKCPQ